MSGSSVIIVGCGYIGRRVARLEQAAGNQVLGLVRTDDSAQRLRALGIEAVVADLDQPRAPASLPMEGATVYYFAPPPPRGNTDPRMTGFLETLGADQRPSRFVLISTTGVYGDCHGAWVNEERPARPQVDRARRRLAAEKAMCAWAAEHGVAAVILRVAGIYGPGRLPEKRLRAGDPVLRENEAPFSNRVHADDLAQACVAAARRGHPGGVYNITDGQPTTMTDYFNRVADHLGLARPPQISRTEAQSRLSDGMLSYLAESKRLDNRRMREELGVEPRYPDLASGLAACRTPAAEEEPPPARG